MGRLELRIPLTEVVVVEEDHRLGLMRIVIEGEVYPSWFVGNAALAIRVDRGSSMMEIGETMMKIEDAKALRSARPNQLIRDSKDLASDERPNV